MNRAGKYRLSDSCMKNIILLFAGIMFFTAQPAFSQTNDERLGDMLESYFSNYQAPNFQPNANPRLKYYDIDTDKNVISVDVDATFASQPLTAKIVNSIYKSLHDNLPDEYKKYKLVIYADGKELAECIPNPYRNKPDRSKTWGNINYKGSPWVVNVSKAYTPTKGLQNRHLSVCASHGRYYNNSKNKWEWQRPYIYCTTEDLLTQTIVVPFLIPMLQNAGAVVYSPRERDWQCNEIIVDNDSPTYNGLYEEKNVGTLWEKSALPGFANPKKIYVDNENPFSMGTARNVRTTNNRANVTEAAWIPNVTEAGNYAVYVSYQSNPDAVSSAQYTVYHCGVATKYYVNQKMGGSTWVYLGTFYFSKGQSRENCVVLTNYSNEKGTVSADAVRFGGGMGNIARGFNEETGELFTSGLPRYLEGARYSAQWSGMPYSAYSVYGGENDYKDDINARSYSTNYLAGGSVYLPSTQGAKVPIELSLAVHSDAGYKENNLIGTLGVCTTSGINGEKSYPTGLSRDVSNDMIQMIIDNVSVELSRIYGLKWSRREVFDRMYSETCRPDIPSAIIEMFSHQNFKDMTYAHDPNFKFNIARSIYKSILRYIAFEHDFKYVVSPLAPDNFSIEFVGKDEVSLNWAAVQDSLEPTAKPEGYIVYTRIGSGDFDNGVYVKKQTSFRKKLVPGKIYSFKVTAVNKGGESFPSEVLSACRAKTSNRAILIVNCFNRLSGPKVINNADSIGFDLKSDMGVPYIQTPAYSGEQRIFSTDNGDGLSGELGYSSNEFEGRMIAGNTFDYVISHGRGYAPEYSFVSCSRKSVETGSVDLSKYPMVDIIFGLEKYEPSNLKHYKTFTLPLRSRIETYISKGGRVLVSGAYIGSDMKSNAEKKFLKNVLRCSYGGTSKNPMITNIKGMDLSFNIYREPNGRHYAATQVDMIKQANGARTVFYYSDGTSAGTSYRSSKGSAVVLGFPLECIKESDMLNKVLLNIARYLQSE